MKINRENNSSIKYTEHEIRHIKFRIAVVPFDGIEGYQQQEYASHTRLFSVRGKGRQPESDRVRPRNDHYLHDNPRERRIGGRDSRTGETPHRLAQGVLRTAADLRG